MTNNSVNQSDPLLQKIANMRCEYRVKKSLNSLESGVLKSAVQKYVRRGELEKAIFCAAEIDMFKLIKDKNEKIRKQVVTVRSNLRNRLVVMLNEEVSVANWTIWKPFYKSLMKWEKERSKDTFNEKKYLINMVKLMTKSKKVRLPSHIKSVYGSGLKYHEIVDMWDQPLQKMKETTNGAAKYFYKPKDGEEIKKIMDGLVHNLLKSCPNVFYWMFKLMWHPDIKSVTRERRDGKSKPGFIILNMLRYFIVKSKNKHLLELHEIALIMYQEFDNSRGENILTLINIILFYLRRDEIDWTRKNDISLVTDSQAERYYKINQKFKGVYKFDDYVIDMHCKAGKMKGKGRKDFALEGSLVTNESKKFLVPLWKKIYNAEKFIQNECDEYVKSMNIKNKQKIKEINRKWPAMINRKYDRGERANNYQQEEEKESPEMSINDQEELESDITDEEEEYEEDEEKEEEKASELIISDIQYPQQQKIDSKIVKETFQELKKNDPKKYYKYAFDRIVLKDIGKDWKKQLDKINIKDREKYANITDKELKKRSLEKRKKYEKEMKKIMKIIKKKKREEMKRLKAEEKRRKEELKKLNAEEKRQSKKDKNKQKKRRTCPEKDRPPCNTKVKKTQIGVYTDGSMCCYVKKQSKNVMKKRLNDAQLSNKELSKRYRKLNLTPVSNEISNEPAPVSNDFKTPERPKQKTPPRQRQKTPKTPKQREQQRVSAGPSPGSPMFEKGPRRVPKFKINSEIEEKLPFMSFKELTGAKSVKQLKTAKKVPVGGKVPTFINREKGWIVKHQKKSFNYGRDQAIVDELKDIFGVKKMNVRRYRSDKVTQRINKKVKKWKENMRIVDEPSVYLVIDLWPNIGTLVEKKQFRDNDNVRLKYLKILLYRGIFLVTDGNYTNTLINKKHEILSIDENNIGARRYILNKVLSKYTKDEINEVIDDLMSNYKAKKKAIKKIFKKYQMEHLLEGVLKRFKKLRKRVWREFKYRVPNKVKP